MTWSPRGNFEQSGIIHVADLVGGCADQLNEDTARARDASLIVAATWIEQQLCGYAARRGLAELGVVDVRTAWRIVNTMARLFMSPAAAGYVADCIASLAARRLPNLALASRQDMTIGGVGLWMTLSVDGQACNLLLPTLLRPRRLILAMVGHFLSCHPCERDTGWTLPPQMLKELRMQIDHWPLAAIDWVSIETGNYVQSDAALRAKHGISPRYFEAHSELLRNIGQAP